MLTQVYCKSESDGVECRTGHTGSCHAEKVTRLVRVIFKIRGAIDMQ